MRSLCPRRAGRLCVPDQADLRVLVFLAAVFFAGSAFLAVPDVFFAVVFFAGAGFSAGVAFFAAVFFAGAFLAGAFLAADRAELIGVGSAASPELRVDSP